MPAPERGTTGAATLVGTGGIDYDHHPPNPGDVDIGPDSTRISGPFFGGKPMDVEERFEKLYGPYFTYQEFKCKCEQCSTKTITPGVGNMDDGEWLVTPEFRSFMALLIKMRIELYFPFPVNSGFRCKTYNAKISSTGFNGPHTKGAADIKVAFERAYKLNNLAGELDMGIGLNQTGDIADRYIHVDNLGARLWTY